MFILVLYSDFDARYKFIVNELGNKTSYTYFGARYYDADLSSWLSVDFLSDKYPSLSLYCYSTDDPVVLVDPNGTSISKFNENDFVIAVRLFKFESQATLSSVYNNFSLREENQTNYLLERFYPLIKFY
ncbi:MAG: RHS repeat-associated core domain-containing protein [Bacteroidales bacterium]|nr:RHS repeat-associated core domain-containing protein [Bacteroidales bacterium]